MTLLIESLYFSIIPKIKKLKKNVPQEKNLEAYRVSSNPCHLPHAYWRIQKRYEKKLEAYRLSSNPCH